MIIEGHDDVEEFLACGMYPLASDFGFRNVTVGMIAMSKVKAPLPLFVMEVVSAEDAGCFLVKVETDIERILGNYGLKEHDVLMTVKLSNGGRLNRVFEQMGVPYAPRSLPGTEAFQVAMKKQKAEMSKKPSVKKAKVAQGKAAPTMVAPLKNISMVKVIRPKANPGLGGTSEIELILVKPIGVSKIFCLSDVPSTSQSRHDEG
jgi:hypothetical protein